MEKINKTPSISKKLLIYLLGFSGLLLIILWLFQVVFLDSFYKNIKVTQIKKAANTIAANLNNENLAQMVVEMGENNEICTEIINTEGDITYGYETGRNCIIHKMPIIEKLTLFNNTLSQNNQLLLYVNSNKQETGASYSYGVTPSGRVNTAIEVLPSNIAIAKTFPQSIIYTKTIKDQQGQSLMILMNSSISPVDATVSTLRIQLYYITGIMIILSGGLAYLISKRISKPIENLNQGAKTLAKGSYNVEFRGKGYKEIEELSESLNIAAKELSKVDNLRKELIANVSHDLRTPLTLITGYAEAMRDLPNELSQENAQVIVSEGKRLSSLVNDLLEISKSEQGQIPIKLTSYNLTHQTQKTINAMNDLLKPEGYTLEFSYDQEVIINSDQTRLTQALYNLLINAVNHSGENKTVIVKQELYTKEKEIWAKIKVYDTGAGISKEDAPYIWERYYKGNTHHQRAITGSGLGLSIVKNTLDQLKGTYGFETQEIGSMFYIAVKVN